MIPRLSSAFLNKPIAHRGLHDVDAGRPENSLAAFEAAAKAGFGIELDVQMASDGGAMVFHDYALERMTGRKGAIRSVPSTELRGIPLIGGDAGIPTLSDVLECVSGRVPLLVEIKDQDGALGPDVGPLESEIAKVLSGYSGDVAVMSFNPHSMSAMQTLLPDCPRGLVTEGFDPTVWPVPEETLHLLSRIVDFERVGASFISHYHKALGAPRVAELKRNGTDILCWTVRSRAEQIEAMRIAQNITFEGYLPVA